MTIFPYIMHQYRTILVFSAFALDCSSGPDVTRLTAPREPDTAVPGLQPKPDAGPSDPDRNSPPPTACLPGSRRCSERAHERCTGSGDAWVTLALCPSCGADQSACDAETGCTASVCCPGTVACVGTDLRVCDADGAGWTTEQRCASAAACDESSRRCLTPSCSTGERRCNDATGQVEECVQGVRWIAVETCATACLCLEGLGQAVCREPVCERGELLCRGARLGVCNSCQTGFEPLETCESADACDAVAGSCTQ